MRKLKLELEELRVESLVMDSETGGRGTVLGRAQALPTADGWCDTENCGGGTDEQASFDYACPTMFMLDSDCADYTGVLKCGPTGFTC